jgi:hypothetical protein
LTIGLDHRRRLDIGSYRQQWLARWALTAAAAGLMLGGRINSPWFLGVGGILGSLGLL